METGMDIAAGSRVKLHGLKTLKYNDKHGICHGNHDSGRHIVEVDGSRILVKRENIELLPPRDPVKAFIHPSPPQATLPDAAAWSRGLDSAAAAEWFVDCYRLRVDDTYAWGGDVVGLYDPGHKPKDILRHFLLFCKLAVYNHVVPADFDWQLCFERFGKNLNYAFEKSDASEKYGSENVFSAMMGGRSLRYTGEVVYGQGVAGGEYKPGVEEETERLERLIQKVRWKGPDPIFDDVGGWSAWKVLVTKVK